MNELTRVEPQAVARCQPTALEILNSAISGGITADNVAVVKELIAMQREEMALQNKAKFNRAFFELKQEIAHSDFYADKAASNNGKVAYTYCSERELQSKLDPLLSRHGFAMLFGQRDDGAKTIAIITLIHQEGHEETREYAVRSGATNAMKDATAADTGATTSAWRHLVMKMFGLKSRIVEADDAKNLGSTISRQLAEELHQRAKLTNSNEIAILKMAGIVSAAPCLADYEKINSIKYEVIDQMLRMKERAGK